MQQVVKLTLQPLAQGFAVGLDAGTPLPLTQMLIGRSVADVVSLLPRVFNLCRSAQEGAARLALGLPLAADFADQLARELLRDHLIKFCLSWPRCLNRPAQPLPTREQVPAALFGALGRMPANLVEFDRWLASGQGMAPLLQAIEQAFAPGEAVSVWPLSTPDSMFQPTPQDNTTAIRHHAHPVLQGLRQRHGAGPLWRAVARLIDAEACVEQRLPGLQCLPDGTALAPAARGIYALQASAQDGRLCAFRRVTPTDHLLMAQGVLAQSFASLPHSKMALAPLLVDILDPCVPCQWEEVANA